MVNYPNGKPAKVVKQDISYGGRGMPLEDDLNATNRYYLDIGRAVIYKKPTPITIVKVDYRSRATARITEAYFQVPSTTDYNGVYRGKYLDFEAKETHSRTSLALAMIHPHQLQHLQRVIDHGGIAFLIIRFDAHDETFFVMAQDLLDRIAGSTARSIPYSWFKENGKIIPYNYTIKVDYLRYVDPVIDGGNHS